MDQSVKAFLLAHGFVELMPGYWNNQATGWVYSNGALGVEEPFAPSRFYTMASVDGESPQWIFKAGR